jgi:hypothetical protein
MFEAPGVLRALRQMFSAAQRLTYININARIMLDIKTNQKSEQLHRGHCKVEQRQASIGHGRSKII